MGVDVAAMKHPSGALSPATDRDAEALEALPAGQTVRCRITVMRNPEFHKKFFAMLGVAFEAWEPPAAAHLTTGERRLLRAFSRFLGIREEGRVLLQFLEQYQRDDYAMNPDFEQFRKDLLILAGYHRSVARLDGSVRLEAQSMSWARMDETEFQRLYSSVADVILQRVLTQYTRDDLDEVVEQILEFV